MHATGNVFFPLSAGALARLLAHHKHAFMASGDQIAWIQTHHGNEPACSLFCVSVSWLFSHHLPLFFLCCCPTMSCVCVYFIMARQPEGLHFVCYCHHQNGVKFSAVLFFFRLKTKLRLSSMHWCLTKENETHYRWFLSACCIRKTCGLNVCIYLILVEWMNGEVKWISSLCYAFCAFATSVHLRKPTDSIGLLIRLDYFVPLYILSSVVYFFHFYLLRSLRATEVMCSPNRKFVQRHAIFDIW